jgi:ATP-dependent helicase/nuclease subunit B
MLDADDTFRAAREARVLGSELVFGRDGSEPVVVDLADGEIRMSGSADRVDQTRDGVLLVTDIKTGSARSFTGIGQADPVAGGTKLQLPVYALAARQTYNREQAEAMYWFARRDRGTRITLQLDDQLEQIYARTLTTIVTSIATGLFPAKSPEVPDVRWVRCPWCNPDGLGHGQARARYERKRHAPMLADLIALIDSGAPG